MLFEETCLYAALNQERFLRNDWIVGAVLLEASFSIAALNFERFLQNDKAQAETDSN